MNKLCITYSEGRTGGGVLEGDEDSAWPSYNPVYRTFQILDVYTPETYNGTVWYKEEVLVDFEPVVDMKVYVVTVRYSTGNTFGRINGCWEIVGVYDNVEDVRATEEKINNGTFSDYPAWVGYFEYLERIDIDSFIIK